ncbi:MAG: hypothetical protein AB2L11_08170 [Syntrophobacteraceae bacterium]
MGEIKSTLELVMERTRNLTLSEDERREQMISEFRKNINGLLQRFQDGVLPLRDFTIDFQRLQEPSKLSAKETLLEEIAKRLDPDRNNEQMLLLLSEYCGAKAMGIETVLSEYASKIKTGAEQTAAKLKEELSSKQGIYGSAVVPNLEADADWASEKQHMRNFFHKKLSAEIKALKC